MKIRLWGTGEECTAAAGRLTRTPGLIVLSVSGPRADRGASVLVRVYVEARLDPPPAPAPVHVAATAGSRPQQAGMRAPALAQRRTRRRALPPGGDR